MKPIYYLIFGSKECVTRPLARFETLAEANEEIKTLREDGTECFYITAGNYRKLTGRTAYQDFLAESLV